MNDKELLELAAKAAGIEVDYRRGSDAFYYDNPDTGREEWNPLTDDGDALRLAVKLEMNLFVGDGGTQVEHNDHKLLSITEYAKDDDPYAATRRAIVRAAAEIGRNMK